MSAISSCQICGGHSSYRILSLGYLPPCNDLRGASKTDHEVRSFPTTLVRCDACELVQLDYVVDQSVAFPRSYPYTSSTTAVLRENFSRLASECRALGLLSDGELVVDIGGNDGNLLSYFQEKNAVLNITPEDIGQRAVERGIATMFEYFNEGTAERARELYGSAKIITATNVFAHVTDVHGFVRGVLTLLAHDGVFVTESHYLGALVEGCQWDTIYAEHQRYYSVAPLRKLFDMHGLEIFAIRRIPTHGGSIRVYAARKGSRPVEPAAASPVERHVDVKSLNRFASRVAETKLELWGLVYRLKSEGHRIYGVGAPSRAGTLISYTGLDHTMIPYIAEVPGSHKIGQFMPGTRIEVVNEATLYEDQPEFTMLFSWHIAEELMPKLRKNGYHGRFVVPLPRPRVIS